MSKFCGGSQKKHKFGAVKVTIDGITFASKLEASLYGLLKMRERAGEISQLKCQPRVKFHTHDHGFITMIPDFSFVLATTGRLRYAEAKGSETQEWKRKKKAWAAGGIAPMEVWKGTARKPSFSELIVPGALIPKPQKAPGVAQQTKVILRRG